MLPAGKLVTHWFAFHMFLVAGVVARIEDRVAEHLVRLEGVLSCAKGVEPVAGVVVGGVAAERVAAVALPSRVHVGGPRTSSRSLGGRSPATSPLVIRSRAGGSCSSGEGGPGRRLR